MVVQCPKGGKAEVSSLANLCRTSKVAHADFSHSILRAWGLKTYHVLQPLGLMT